MATIELGAANFDRTLTENEIVLVDFWASWCGPCGQFAPVYEHASLDHPDVVFGKVRHRARAVPGRRRAAHLHSHVGGLQGRFADLLPARRALPAAALEQVITAVRELSTEQIRTENEQSRSA